MKILVWFSGLIALAVGLALLLRNNTGLLVMQLFYSNGASTRMTMAFNAVLIILIVVVIVIGVTLRLLYIVRTLPDKIQSHRERQRKDKATNYLYESLRYCLAGHFNQAIKSAEQAYTTSNTPEIAALIAARAAQQLHDPDKLETWLQKIDDNNKELAAARLMLKTKMLMETQNYEDAIKTLSQLQESEGRYPESIILELDAMRATGKWEEVLRLAHQLEQIDALAPEQITQIRRKAYSAQLKECAHDSERLRAWLAQTPQSEMNTALIRATATALAEAELWQEAREFIERSLTNHWDSELLYTYAYCPGGDSNTATTERVARIACAEKWLEHNPQDAAILYTLGRLCHAEHLWGKAKSYLEASLSIASNAKTHLALAILTEELGEPKDAERQFRACALLSQPEQAWKCSTSE